MKRSHNTLNFDLKASPSVVRIQRQHYPLIKEWYRSRGLKTPETGMQSDMGYIADGRVAGFLYLTNSNIAMIEGIISDPNTVPSLRRESLFKLCGFLTDVAMSLGYSKIIGLTTADSIVKTAEKLGYKEIKGYRFIALADSEE